MRQPKQTAAQAGSSCTSTDSLLWQNGISRCLQQYQALQPEVQHRLNDLLKQMSESKSALMALVAASGSAPACRRCGGECCLFGKYHVTPLDIMAMLAAGTVLPEPDFSVHPACPYATGKGCTMTAAYRPVTCIIFNCDLLDQHFTEAVRSDINRHELGLRSLTADCNRLLGTRFDRPLLLWIADTLPKEANNHDSSH